MFVNWIAVNNSGPHQLAAGRLKHAAFVGGVVLLLASDIEALPCMNSSVVTTKRRWL